MKASVALLLLLGAQLVSSPAEACVCAPTAQLIWPREGSSDVALQVPLVIAIYGTPGNAHWQLETPSGDPVETTAVRTLQLEGMNGGNCAPTLVFASSIKTLGADTEFHVRLGRQNEPDEVLSFRTGSTEQPARPEPAVLEYDRLSEASRFGDMEPLDSIELRLQNREVTLPSLLFLHGEGEALGVATSIGSAWPWTGGPRLARAISADTACADVEQISMTGETVATQSFCKPDRCARLADDTALLGSSCDSWFTMGDDFWDALPEDSCATVPTVHVDDETGAVDVEGFGDADDRPVREMPADESVDEVPASVDAASGCELASYPAARLPTCLLALAIILCRAARRRARS